MGGGGGGVFGPERERGGGAVVLVDLVGYEEILERLPPLTMHNLTNPFRSPFSVVAAAFTAVTLLLLFSE